MAMIFPFISIRSINISLKYIIRLREHLSQATNLFQGVWKGVNDTEGLLHPFITIPVYGVTGRYPKKTHNFHVH